VREPWKYGTRVLEIVRQAYHLHVKLVPYFYHLARAAYDEGLPIHRPLHLLYPHDGAAYEAVDQYFIGDRLLAAPVAAPGGRRQVYIPAGGFYAWHDGERLSGPARLDRVFPLEQIPLFARAGSIIPQQEVTTRVGSRLPDPLVLIVHPEGNDDLALYEDDGTTQAYQEGACSHWPIALRDDGRRITVSLAPVAGSFDGMAARRAVRIEVRAVVQPARVDITGATGKAKWSYLETQRMVEIRLPQVDAAGSCRVVIDR
jgi:alpha-glucosidase